MKALIERISKSIFFGILAGVALALLVFAVDGGQDSGRAIEERTQFAWVLMWPGLLWNRILSEDASLIAILLTQVTIFSAALLVVFSKWAKSNRLP